MAFSDDSSSSSYSPPPSPPPPPPSPPPFTFSPDAGIPCFYCSNLTTRPRPGWQLRNGEHSLLCQRCGSAYDEGIFCTIFHMDNEGWRNCSVCDKAVHCGCIMSANTFLILDFGGVKCNECATSDASVPIQRPSSPLDVAPETLDVAPETLQDLRDPSKIGQSVDSDQVIPGRRHGKDPVGPSSHAGPDVLPNEMNAQNLTPGAPSQAQAPSPKLGPQSYANSPIGADTSCDIHIGSGNIEGAVPGQTHLHVQNSPKTTDEELGQIFRDPNSVFIPLFVKTLTVSDTEPRLGRLVIPKRFAEAYLPKISGSQGFPIKVLDTSGNDWDFHYRFWPNGKSKMYVLEGLKDFMIAMQWKAGDIVEFYRMEPGGKLVMGLKNAQSGKSDLKSSA